MASTVELIVAIYHDEGVYRHWGLFIDGPTKEQQMVLQVEGSTKRYRFDRQFSNARDSDGIAELVPLCRVPLSNISAIDEAAEKAPIYNQYESYNCQDYVMELLELLEEKGLIDGEDTKYQEQKALVLSKEEGRE